MTQTRAMSCALAAFFIWVVVDTAIKFCSQGPGALSPFAIMATIGIFGAASLAGSALFKHKVGELRPRRWREQAWIAVCSIGINYANVIALKHLPLTMFYVVVFTIPLMIAAISAMLKHEILTPTKISCLIAGFLGTALAIGVKGGGGDWLGYLAAFVSVICFAASTILMRKISKTVTAESTQFLMSLSVGVVGIAGAMSQSSPVLERWALALMILGGGINVFGSLLYNKALQNTSSTNVAQLHYTQIISGGLFGYLLWREIPTWNLVAGSLIIITSGLIVAAQAAREDFAWNSGGISDR